MWFIMKLSQRKNVDLNVDFSHRIFFLKLPVDDTNFLNFSKLYWHVTNKNIDKDDDIKVSNEYFWTVFRLTRSSESEPLWMSWNFYEFVNVRVDSAIAVNSMTHENEWCWWHFVVMFTFSQELWMVVVGHHSMWDTKSLSEKGSPEKSVFWRMSNMYL